MATNDVIKNFNLFVDGRGLAGKVEDWTPPTLEVTTEAFRGAGRDAPESIDMGLELLETSFNLLSQDVEVLALVGLGSGANVSLVGRAALQSEDGTVTPMVVTMRGQITRWSPGTVTPGGKTVTEVTAGLHYYKLDHGGRVVHEVDVRNYRRIINGVDRLAEMRRAMGI